MVDTSAADYLALVTASFPEARIVGLGITDPLLSQFRASWNSQSPAWQTEMGALFRSQPDQWVLAALTALPAPLAVKSIGYVGPNAPPLPLFDTLWYDDQHETWKRWNGTQWVSQTGAQSGVATVNGLSGTVTLTAAGLGAVSTASIGVTGGPAGPLTSTGKVPTSQQLVASVAGKVGTVTLVVGDVLNAVSTASIGVSGGIVPLDSTGHIAVGFMPAGYTGGGGGSSPVLSVAGKIGSVVLTVTDVTNAAALDPSTNRLALGQLPQKAAVTAIQPGTAVAGTGTGSAGRITPGGIPFPYATTLSYGIVSLSRAPIGSSASVNMRVRVQATQAFAPLGTITIPAGIKRVVTALSLAVNGGDKFFADVTGVGATEPGGDITVQILGVGAVAPPSILAAPSVPLAVNVIATSTTSKTITWNPPSTGLVSVYPLYKTTNGGSLTWVADIDAGTTSYLDSGLTPGDTIVYQLGAANDDASSANATATTATVGVSIVPHADGAPDATKFTILKGTAVTTAGAVITTNRIRYTSGPTGGSSVTDHVTARDIVDPVRTCGEVRGYGQFSDGRSYHYWFISTNAYDVSTGGTATTYLRCQWNMFSWVLAVRTSTGVFTSIANGTWSLSATTDYGFRFVADPIAGDGSQIIRAYQGTAAAYAADPTTLTQVGSGTVPSATRSLIPSGYMNVEQYGTPTGQTPIGNEWTEWGDQTFIAGTS